jgi:uncharacterized protein (DUF1330 family)
MSYEMVMGLLVLDHAKYTQYRAEIAPLLEAAGARFRYDFEVAGILRSEAEHEINRVFVLQFPDRTRKEQFFSSAQYLEIRARLFEPAVGGVTTLTETTAGTATSAEKAPR